MATRKTRSDKGTEREVTQRAKDASRVLKFFDDARDAGSGGKTEPPEAHDAHLAARRVAKFLQDLDGRDDMPKQRARKPRAK